MIRTIRDIWDRKRMRRLSRARVTAAENERKHLARELHDEFLQSLVAFKIRGKLLVDETDRKERERAWAAIADEILDAMRGVRRMIRGLTSPKLEEHGLVSAGELASLDLDLGRFDMALAGYERMRELARTPSQHADYLGRLKRYYRFRGRMDDAIRTAEAWVAEVSGVYTPLATARTRLADIGIHLEADRYEEAAALFETLRSELGLDAPENEPYFVTHWRIRLALEAGESAAARAFHSAAMDRIQTWEAEGLRPAWLADLGRIEETVGNYDEAIVHYRDALFPDDGMVDVYRRLGGALRKAGRLDEAETELREALRLVPADPHSHLELAKVLEPRGDTEGAVTHLGRALAAWEPADESFEPAHEARAKLAELEGRAVPTAHPDGARW